VLLLTEAWIRNLQHQLAQVPVLLDQAESLLRSQTAMPTASAEIAFFRGYIAYFEGQAERSLQYLENSVSQLAITKSPFLGEAELMLGLARCMVGQKKTAIQTLEARIGEVEPSANYLFSRLIAGLAFIYQLWGELPRTRVEAQRLLRVSKAHKMGLAEAWSWYFLGWSHLHAEELEAALFHFAKAVDRRYVLEPRAAVDALAGLVLTQQLMRLDAEAAESCRRLQEFASELQKHNFLSVAQSCQARLSVLRGDVNLAVEWGRSFNELPAEAEVFMWLEAPSITQARVLIADGTRQNLLKAAELLRTTRDLCEARRFKCQIIEVAVLQSMALEKLRRSDEALTALEEAVSLAEPAGWVRPFVELGSPMADLLRRLLRQNVAVEYVNKLLAAFGDFETKPVQDASESESHLVTPARLQPLVEPLTNRELDILDLLAQRFQNKEIADKLFISPETVKTHLNNIYQKLNVTNRRNAVEKAKSMGIL
jgi:LuxR family maltose regulon positive regulatory protein